MLVLIISVICALSGLAVLLGKGDSLISGYNTASEKEKEKEKEKYISSDSGSSQE